MSPGKRGGAASNGSHQTDSWDPNAGIDNNTWGDLPSQEETVQEEEVSTPYKSQLARLMEVFSPDWSQMDLIAALEEVGGDFDEAVNRITEGTAARWNTSVKRGKSKKEVKVVEPPSSWEQKPAKPTFEYADSRPTRGSGRGGRGGRAGGRGGRGAPMYPRPPRPQNGFEMAEAKAAAPAAQVEVSIAANAATSFANDTAPAVEAFEAEKVDDVIQSKGPTSKSGGYPSKLKHKKSTEDGRGGKASAAKSGSQSKPVSSSQKLSAPSWAQLVKGPDPVPTPEPPITTKPTTSSTVRVEEPVPIPSTPSTNQPKAKSPSRSPSPVKAAPSPQPSATVTTHIPDNAPSAVEDAVKSTSTTQTPLAAATTTSQINDSPSDSSDIEPIKTAKTLAPGSAPPGLQQQKPRVPSVRKLNQDAPVIMPSSMAPVQATLRFGQFGAQSGPEEKESSVSSQASGQQPTASSQPVARSAQPHSAPSQPQVQQPQPSIAPPVSQSMVAPAVAPGLVTQRIPNVHPMPLLQQPMVGHLGGGLPTEYGNFYAGDPQQQSRNTMGYYTSTDGSQFNQGSTQKYGIDYNTPTANLQSQNQGQQVQQQTPQTPQMGVPSQQGAAPVQQGYVPYGFYHPYYVPNQFQSVGYPSSGYGQPFVGKGVYPAYANPGSASQQQGQQGQQAQQHSIQSIGVPQGQPSAITSLGGNNIIGNGGLGSAAANKSNIGNQYGYNGQPQLYHPGGYDELSANLAGMGINSGGIGIQDYGAPGVAAKPIGGISGYGSMPHSQIQQQQGQTGQGATASTQGTQQQSQQASFQGYGNTAGPSNSNSSVTQPGSSNLQKSGGQPSNRGPRYESHKFPGSSLAPSNQGQSASIGAVSQPSQQSVAGGLPIGANVGGGSYYNPQQPQTLPQAQQQPQGQQQQAPQQHHHQQHMHPQYQYYQYRGYS